jgi:hypothetical protein
MNNFIFEDDLEYYYRKYEELEDYIIELNNMDDIIIDFYNKKFKKYEHRNK